MEASSESTPVDRDAPVMRCASGYAAATRTSKTPRNPDRQYLRCKNAPEGCFLWIWEDLLNQYVKEIVLLHTAELNRELLSVQGELGAAKDLQTLTESRLAMLDLDYAKCEDERLALMQKLDEEERQSRKFKAIAVILLVAKLLH